MTTFLIILALVAISVTLTYRRNKKVWNGGKCKCGGKWMPSQKFDPPYYACNKCGHSITPGFGAR